MAKDNISRKIKGITEAVNVRWAHIVNEDSRYGGYKITVDFTDEQREAFEELFDEALGEVHDKAKTILKKKSAKRVGIRFKEATTKDGDLIEGISTLTFSSTYASAIFDVKGNVLKLPKNREDLWGGDIVRVAYAGNVDYQTLNGEVAVKFYLQGVQLLEFKSGGNLFGDETGSYDDYTANESEEEVKENPIASAEDLGTAMDELD